MVEALVKVMNTAESLVVMVATMVEDMAGDSAEDFTDENKDKR